jgi:hypothetical protein
MHRDHPQTFWVPDDDTLAAIVPGWLVKLCAGRERFWVEVSEVTETLLHGRVGNVLVFPEEHGLDLDDEVTFERRHVYDVAPPEEQGSQEEA